MKLDIHNYPLRLQRTLERVRQNSHIRPQNKEIIIKFYEDCSLQGLTKARLIRLMDTLILLAKDMPKDFDTAEVEDIKQLVRTIEDRELTPWTKSTHKAILKKFYKWLKGNNLLTGRPDAIFLRNKYQKELDNAWAAFVNMVHYVEEESQKLKDAYTTAQGLKQDIKAHESERADLYDSLGNLLTKETDFEDKMWKTTQKGKKVKSITVKQNIKESDVDEMRFDSMMEFLKQYPEYASKSSFKKILEKIDQKEGEIRQAKKTYNDAVSKYNYFLSFFEKHTQKAEDKLEAYNTVFKEGKEKLENCRYKKSVFYKMASEEVKAEVNLDTLNHRVEQFKNTLKIMKGELAQNQRKTFTEMEY